MNKELLRIKAIDLELLLWSYSKKDHAAMELLKMLSELIKDSKLQKIEAPLEWRVIPGARLFSEDGLSKYSDLEKAFADFRIEITGGESPALKRLKARHGN